MKSYMRIQKPFSRGFTLIELLVVIAIIGILASTILISLNTARGKGNDVKVMSAVKQLRTQLENDYNGASYPDLITSGGLYGGFSVTAPGSTTITTLISDAMTSGGAINVVTSPGSDPVTGYAIYGRLVSSSTAYFCLDSVGHSDPTAPNNSGTTCP